MKRIFLFISLFILLSGCKKEYILDSKSSKLESELENLKLEFIEQTPDSIMIIDAKIIQYFRGKTVVTIDSSFSDFKISSPLSLKNKLVASTITIDDDGGYTVGSSNPARIKYLAQVKCEAYSNGIFFVESVSGLTMSVVNGSQTTYHPNNITESWYTTITGQNCFHSPVGGPAVTLYWRGSKITRHTTQVNNGIPQSTITQTPISVQRTVVATGQLL